MFYSLHTNYILFLCISKYIQKSFVHGLQNGEYRDAIKVPTPRNPKKKTMYRTKSADSTAYPSDASFRHPHLTAGNHNSDDDGSHAARSTATILPGQIRSNKFFKDKLMERNLEKYKSEFYYEELEAAAQVLYKCSWIQPFIDDEIAINIFISGLATSYIKFYFILYHSISFYFILFHSISFYFIFIYS